jgi:hypothetical protein
VNENAVVLLRTLLERSRSQTAGALSDVEHETFWVAEQYLKTTGVSPQELAAGIVDGEKDCGIDAVYIFANGICIKDDTPLAALGKEPRLELTIVQVKDTVGFKEDSIDKLIVNLPRLLRFDRNENELLNFANGRLIEATRRFLDAYRDTDMPELTIYVVFASLRATSIHPNVELKGKELQKTCESLFGACPVHIQFLDAAQLYDYARESRIVTRTLQLGENPISTDMAGGYIGVVRLREYERFITADSGELDASRFEANVRDYEGETPVNRSIQETLSQAGDTTDFWWLNNGVTIVATKIVPANKLLQLESPQIVNGLQTSTEIYKRARSANAADDGRSVLVKVIEAKDTATRERIIRATNSQTSFGLSALRATDRVQRQIEDYLAPNGLYYERRRRQYFNQGKPLDKIISIDLMGQAIVSILTHLPHIARGAPGRIFEQETYDLVFRLNHPVGMYAAAIRILRLCDEKLRGTHVENPEDFRFHMAMSVAILSSRKHRPSSEDVAALEHASIDGDLVDRALILVQEVYDSESRRRRVFLLDQIAKSEQTTARLLELVRGRLQSTRR